MNALALQNDAMTKQDIVNRISFPVAEQDVFTMGIDGQPLKVEGKKAIVRTDLNVALSVVSQEYGLVRHEEALGTALDAISSTGFTLNRLDMHGAGKKLVIEATNKEHHVIINGDIHFPRIQVFNTLDGSGAVKVQFGLYRLVCFNGMVALTTDKSDSFSVNHHSKALEEIQTWQQRIEGATWINEYRRLLESFNVPIGQANAENLLQFVFLTEDQIKNQIESARVIKALEYAREGIGQDGNLTKWSVLNGVTQLMKEYRLKAIDDNKNVYGRTVESNRIITKAQNALMNLN